MATRLIFRTQPDGAVVSTAFTQQPVAWAVDDAGALDTSYTGTVTIAKKYGTGSLSGTAAVAASGGIVTWSGLSFGTAGHVVFEITASGLTAARSGYVTVNGAAQSAKTVLQFGANTTDRGDCGSAADVDDLTAADMTVVQRIKRTADASNQFLAAKWTGWYLGLDNWSGTEGRLVATVKHGTTDAFSLSDTSNLCAIGAWVDVAVKWTISDKIARLYRATVGSALAEVSGYDAIGNKVAGVGSRTSDAAATLTIGNLTTANPAKAQIEWTVIYAKALTAAEMMTVQQAMDLSDGTRAAAMMTAVGSCVRIYRTNATGTLTDLNGSGNSCTITGATTATGETVLTPTVWGESPDAVDQTDYLQPTGHARLKFTTSATSVIIGANRVLSGYDAQNAISVEINGAYDSEALIASTGKSYTTRSLTAGSNKALSLIHTVHSRVGSAGTGTDGIGSNIVSLRFNNTATEVIPSTADRHVVFLNDSILDGFITTPVYQYSPIDRLRSYAAGNPQVTTLGYGGQTLYKIASDGTARTNTTAAVAALAPTIIVLALGVNDYSNNLWTAANFGTAYEDLLAKLIAEIPNVRIKALTPCTLPSGESANGGGSTLGDYRTAIVSAAAGKSAVTVINGPTEVWDGSNPNADNTHPSNTSTPGIATNLKWITEIDLPFPHRQRRFPMRTLLTL